ncbi:hypothetical protein RKD27_003133 [Streptomyces sp. SAI-126]
MEGALTLSSPIAGNRKFSLLGTLRTQPRVRGVGSAPAL